MCYLTNAQNSSTEAAGTPTSVLTRDKISLHKTRLFPQPHGWKDRALMPTLSWLLPPKGVSAEHPHHIGKETAAQRRRNDLPTSLWKPASPRLVPIPRTRCLGCLDLPKKKFCLNQSFKNAAHGVVPDSAYAAIWSTPGSLFTSGDFPDCL